LLCLTLLQAWVPPAALGWNAPGWALSVFWFYYLIFPGVLRWAERRKTQVLWTVAGVAWIAAVGLSIAYVIVKPDHVQYANPYHINLFWLNALKFNPAVRLPEFLLGVALGFQVIRSERWKRYGVQMVLGGVVLLAVLIAVRPLVPYPVMHTGLAAPAFLLLIWGVAAKPKLTALLETKPFVILGDVSLSFYLLHSNILGMMVYAGGGIPRVSPSITFFALFVSIVASVVVYMVIEIPARRWLEGKPRTQAGAVAA
jgi:peptidoglycan/LPS O-acetylase OafA/YrhL